MNKLWHSVVGKLWATILLLVSFVLFVVTALLLEFLNGFHTTQAEDLLRKEAVTISKVVSGHEYEVSLEPLLEDILDNDTNTIIVTQSGELLYTYEAGDYASEVREEVLKNEELVSPRNVEKDAVHEMLLPSLTEDGVMEQYLILSHPFPLSDEECAAVIMYQSLEAVNRTTKKTTYIVLLSAFVAFMLTTFFAFFLSSRITRPLRNMKRAAMELSKGNFDTKLPRAQNDEIGQLSNAFNTMGQQLKEHVELIKQEKEQLSNILTSMTDAVLTFNTEHEIIVKNPPAQEMLQRWYFTNESRGDRREQLPPQITHMLEHAIHFAEQIEEEIEINGSFYRVSMSPLYNSEDETIRGAVVVLRDMTEQHKLERLRSDFIANVSHELRTPIAMLQGYSEAILDDVPQNREERMEMVQIIQDESKRMGRLVTDLLDLAKMESDSVNLYKESLSPTAFFERMAFKFSQLAKDARVDISLDNQLTSNRTIQADEDRLEQVFTNLIDNAIRHTPEYGNIYLRLREFEEAIEMSVVDTGVGIPEEDIPFIFERFYKADKARTRDLGGTGLGLSIAKNIVDAHEGIIYVKRNEFGGTTFTCIFPKEEEEADE